MARGRWMGIVETPLLPSLPPPATNECMQQQQQQDWLALMSTVQATTVVSEWFAVPLPPTATSSASTASLSSNHHQAMQSEKELAILAPRLRLPVAFQPPFPMTAGWNKTLLRYRNVADPLRDLKAAMCMSESLGMVWERWLQEDKDIRVMVPPPLSLTSLPWKDSCQDDAKQMLLLQEPFLSGIRTAFQQRQQWQHQEDVLCEDALALCTPVQIEEMDDMAAPPQKKTKTHFGEPERNMPGIASTSLEWLLVGDDQWVPVESIKVKAIEEEEEDDLDTAVMYEQVELEDQVHVLQGDTLWGTDIGTLPQHLTLVEMPMVQPPVRGRDIQHWNQHTLLQTHLPAIATSQPPASATTSNVSIHRDVHALTQNHPIHWHHFFFGGNMDTEEGRFADTLTLPTGLANPHNALAMEEDTWTMGVRDMQFVVHTLQLLKQSTTALALELSWNPFPQHWNSVQVLQDVVGLVPVVGIQTAREVEREMFALAMKDYEAEEQPMEKEQPVQPFRNVEERGTGMESFAVNISQQVPQPCTSKPHAKLPSGKRKQQHKEFSTAAQLLAFMELRGKGNRANSTGTQLDSNLAVPALPKPPSPLSPANEGNVMERVLENVEFQDVSEHLEFLHFPASVHLLQNVELVTALKQHYRIELWGVETTTPMQTNPEHDLHEADVIVDAWNAIVLQPIHSLLRGGAHQASFVQALQQGLGSQFDTIWVVLEAYDARAVERLSMYPFTPPLMEQVYNELAQAITVEYPSVHLAYSTSPRHSAYLVRTIADQITHSHSTTTTTSSSQKQGEPHAWLGEPPTAEQQFLTSLGMFHPLSAHLVLEACAKAGLCGLGELLAMDWPDLLALLDGIVPLRAITAFYQYFTARP